MKDRIVVCRVCGEEQEFDPEFPYCRKCGVFLEENELKKFRGNLGFWENFKGYSIVLAVLFVFVFMFFSRYYGGFGFVISLLLYFYSKEKERQLTKKG